MTPKEKASQLIGKMCGNNCTETNINRMIKPALIAVDELIIELTEEISPSIHGFRHKYWQEVKEEIKKL